MSQETMPFFDSAEEATAHAIHASGKSFKQVGAALWPDKTIDAAATGLRNALNPNRDERLTADQHVFVANFCGRFDYVHYICMRTNHSRPSQQTPADVAAQLQTEFFSQINSLKGLLNKAEDWQRRFGATA